MGAKFEAIKHATNTGIMWHCENNLEQGSRIQEYVKGNVKIIGDGAVDKSRFETDFKTSHPDISMLWNTPYGRIAFSVKIKKTKLTH